MFVSQKPILSNKEPIRQKSTAKIRPRLTKPKGNKILSSEDGLLKKKKRRESSESDKDSTCVEHSKISNKTEIDEQDETFKENALCFVCKWKYPEMMTLDERNSHVNLCLDNKGTRHKVAYLNRLKLAEMNELLLENKKVKYCPLCSKSFKKKGLDYKTEHIRDCLELDFSPSIFQKRNRSLIQKEGKD